jgi:hypothetical protein
MKKPRQVRVDAQQYQKWKSVVFPRLTRAGKNAVENTYPSENLFPTHPQPVWLFKNRYVFRLCLDHPSPKLEWNPAYLSKKIRDHSPPNTVFFADTGFFTKPMDFSVWDAILTRKLIITPQIWGELQDWLDNPFHNESVRDLVRHAYEKRLPSVEVMAIDDYLKAHGYYYYIKLLSYRKLIWKEVSAEFEFREGREPSDSEMRKMLQKKCGDGAVVATKGWEDRNKPNLFADEELVVSAVLTAILRGVEVVILSRDNDLHDQFLMLIKLLNGHYHSMLAGEHFSRYRSDYPELKNTKVDSGLRGIFEEDKVTAITFTLHQVHKFKPGIFMPVLMHCLFFCGSHLERRYSALSFCGETEMRKLLDIRGRTRGMSTNGFGENNCYLVGDPKPPCDSLFLIGKDVTVNLDGVWVTALDLAHASVKRQIGMHFSIAVDSQINWFRPVDENRIRSAGAERWLLIIFCSSTRVKSGGVG